MCSYAASSPVCIIFDLGDFWSSFCLCLTAFLPSDDIGRLGLPTKAEDVFIWCLLRVGILECSWPRKDNDDFWVIGTCKFPNGQ